MIDINKIKFTKDGKKVLIIDELNTHEWLVQEIYVQTNGNEIPQGRKFIVDELFNEPLLTWQEKHINDIIGRYEKEKKEWESRIEQMRKKQTSLYNALLPHINWLRDFAEFSKSESFKDAISLLCDFLSGNIHYIFFYNYTDCHLEEFTEETLSPRDKYFDKEMRLISLFGNSKGCINYKINTYSDGSGFNEKVEFFRNKEDALNFMQNYINGFERYNGDIISMANKYGLHLDETKLKSYQDKQKEAIRKEIERLEKEIQAKREKMSQFDN